jgi:hypothetical protein
MMYLRGVQQIFMDLALNPKIVEAIQGHIINYFIQYNHNVFKSANGAIDIFMMGDDIGKEILLRPSKGPSDLSRVERDGLLDEKS